MRTTYLFIATLLCIQFTYGQELARRASWQAQIHWPDNETPGVVIETIESGSPLDKAGIRTGDRIIQVNDRKILRSEDWSHATYSIRAEEPTVIHVKRGPEWFERKVKLNPLEKETHEGLTTYHESVVSDYGIRQRTIITTPDPKAKLPAIFLIQGLSCSTIEKYSGRSNNWVKMIETLVEQSGMVVMRVDKPGVGDSEGDCGCTDFITELNGYETALKGLKTKDYVDTAKIVVYGASMGSALAPWVANRHNLAGVISDGTFFKTWFEHMLEIERRIRQMSGDDEATIASKLNQAFIPLYYGMMIQKKSYEEVIEEYPAIKDYNYHGPKHMYGRPMEYYQQLQDFDLASSWENVKVPVRILYGENDWIMSEFDNHMIMKVLDRAGHDDHELYIYPGLDHWNTIHETPDDSFHGRLGKWDPQLPQLVINWAKGMVE
ncbi:alpha/beta fold hydrolase [Ekhidna sp. MALMAid0563]|uniref:alpha/beta fold hydrolase n=1 Tax=Ekhidna sp. MALMAid0563 TaxID=3143937 RepID=UPI0032DE4109